MQWTAYTHILMNTNRPTDRFRLGWQRQRQQQQQRRRPNLIYRLAITSSKLQRASFAPPRSKSTAHRMEECLLLKRKRLFKNKNNNEKCMNSRRSEIYEKKKYRRAHSTIARAYTSKEREREREHIGLGHMNDENDDDYYFNKFHSVL